MYQVAPAQRDSFGDRAARRPSGRGRKLPRALEWGMMALAWLAVIAGLAWALLSLAPASQPVVEAGLPPVSGARATQREGAASFAPTDARQAGVRITSRTEDVEVSTKGPGDLVSTWAESLPQEAFIQGVPAGRQQRMLSCELQSASDLAWFYGRPFTWDEIFIAVGHDPDGDPQRGWIGASLDDAPGQLFPRGYGVHAEPVARGLRRLGLDAATHYGQDADWVRERLAVSQPVMVWAVAGMRPGIVESWTTLDGRTVQGVRYEHTFLVIGYDTDHVYVSDPWDGKTHAYAWGRFMDSWGVLGRMALVVNGVCQGPCADHPQP